MSWRIVVAAILSVSVAIAIGGFGTYQALRVKSDVASNRDEDARKAAAAAKAQADANAVSIERSREALCAVALVFSGRVIRIPGESDAHFRDRIHKRKQFFAVVQQIDCQAVLARAKHRREGGATKTSPITGSQLPGAKDGPPLTTAAPPSPPAAAELPPSPAAEVAALVAAARAARAEARVEARVIQLATS